MFFKFKRKVDILQVEDSFAKLLHVSKFGDLSFEFTYIVNQLDAVKQGALSVKVSLFSRTVQQKNLLEDSHVGHLDTRQLISNILTQNQDAKMSSKEQETFLVSTKISDITAKINNEIIPQLRAGVPKNLIPQLHRTRLVSRPAINVKDINDPKPLLQFAAHYTTPDVESATTASIELNTRRTMHDMILRHGVDPSYITQLTHRSMSAEANFGGLLRPSRAPEVQFSPVSNLLNHHIFSHDAQPRRLNTHDVNGTAHIHIAEISPADSLEIPIQMGISRHQQKIEGQDNTNYIIKFELIDGKTGIAVDTITKTLDVSNHIQLYHTPIKAPIVKTSPSEVSSRVNLEIKQVDKGATAVNIYKKTFNRVSVDVEDYTLIGTYKVNSHQHALIVQVDRPKNSAIIYRVIPVGELGTIGFEYTNVVVRPSRFNEIKSLSLVAKASEQGVEVEVRQIPTSVVAIQVQVRNMTTFEKEYRNVGAPILIDDATKEADYVSTIDISVSDHRIYEYVAKLIYRTGTTDLAGHSIIEFIRPVPGKVDIQISNVNVDHNFRPFVGGAASLNAGANVMFNVKSQVLDENIDVILALLRQNDVKEYFNDDVALEREFFKGLIAHNIHRIDLTSGQRENFGVIVGDNFDDKLLRKNVAIDSLKYGHKYRYEISTLLRSPETMFDKFQKLKVDNVTKKQYTFKPSKFFHPLALRRGILVTPEGLKTRYAKESMAHGEIGTIETVELSFDEEPARIIDANASSVNNDLNIITWRIGGSIDQVDHFLIIKDVHGVRTMIGKAHSEFESGNAQYLHRTNNFDKGELRYVIIPIFNDYKIGLPIFTNSISDAEPAGRRPVTLNKPRGGNGARRR